MSVNYKELTKAVTSLNEACGTSIKVVGIKKDTLVDAFTEAMNNGLVDVPGNVMKFFKENFSSKEAEATETKFGNTMEILSKHAGALSVEVPENVSIEVLEDMVFLKIDSLPEKEWNALPVDTRNWDESMGVLAEKLAKAGKSAADEPDADAKPADAEPDADAKPADAEPDAGAKPKKAKKKGSDGPRPDFKFSEGTNAAHIMAIFTDISSKEEGGGVKITDLSAACEKANVKSNNVKGRVSAVIKYASTPEGGSQVKKKDGKIYPV